MWGEYSIGSASFFTRKSTKLRTRGGMSAGKC
jgi:hypothetical protein